MLRTKCFEIVVLSQLKGEEFTNNVGLIVLAKCLLQESERRFQNACSLNSGHVFQQ